MIRKPARTPCWLNKTHPHANGICAAHIMNDQGAVSWDFTRRGNSIPLTNTSWVPDGLLINASGEFGALDNTAEKVLIGNNGTVVMGVKSSSAISDGATRGLFGADVTTGMMVRKEATSILRFYINDAGVNRHMQIASAAIPNWTTGTQVAFAWDVNNFIFDNKKMAINIDGNFIVPSASTNPNLISAFTMYHTLSLGNVGVGNTLFFNGIISYAYFYERVLLETELKSICRKPYGMFYHPKILSNLSSLAFADSFIPDETLGISISCGI